MIRITLAILVCLFRLLHARPASEKEQLINEIAERLVTRYMKDEREASNAGAADYVNFLRSIKGQVEDEIEKRDYVGQGNQTGNNNGNTGDVSNSNNINNGNVSAGNSNVGFGK